MHEVHLARSFGALSHPKEHVNNRCQHSWDQAESIPVEEVDD